MNRELCVVRCESSNEIYKLFDSLKSIDFQLPNVYEDRIIHGHYVDKFEANYINYHIYEDDNIRVRTGNTEDECYRGLECTVDEAIIIIKGFKNKNNLSSIKVVCEDEEDMMTLFSVLDSNGYTWAGGNKLTGYFPTSCRSNITNLGYQEICFCIEKSKHVTWSHTKYNIDTINCRTFMATYFGIRECEDVFEESNELSKFLGSFSLCS